MSSINRYFPVKRKSSETMADFLDKRIKKEVETLNKPNNENMSESNCEVCKNKSEKITELEAIIETYKRKNNELLADNRQLKKMFNRSTKNNFDKDLRIADLERREKTDAKLQFGENVIPTPDQNNSSFSEFAHYFTNEELKALRSVPGVKNRDSSFVLFTIRYLYKNNLDILSTRTASREKNNRKQITPEKKKIIEGIYNERLRTLNLSDHEHRERSMKIVRHITNGCFNAHSEYIKNLKPIEPTTPASQ